MFSYATPQYSRAEVDASGTELVDESSWGESLEEAFAVIDNWRSSHYRPLNTFQVGLRRRARQVDPNSLIAQRIKRLSSIALKLRRFSTLRLSQMQDIAGCRAVVDSVAHVDNLVDAYRKSDIKHKLDHVDDYIRNPKGSGYRGVHLIYRYYSDKKKTYNGLKIEIQLRSKLEHAWATAVETVGTFIQQALKSSQGEEDWLRFFALMGSELAHREQTSPVPGTSSRRKDLKSELREYADRLDVANHLRAYGQALQTLEQPGTQNAHYFLLELDPTAKQIKVTGYKSTELEKASKDYLAVERSIVGKPGVDAVLVSVESLAALHKAYPNYFLDTHVFIQAVKLAIA